MSLAHSRAPRHRRDEPEPRPVENEGWVLASSLRPETRPRSVSTPGGVADEASISSPKPQSERGQSSEKLQRKNAYIHPHGNTKPSEPGYLELRRSKSREAPRKAEHSLHARPWTTCPAPGKKQNPHHESAFHRTWISDCGVSGRPLISATEEFALDQTQFQGKRTGRIRPHDPKAHARQQNEPRRWNLARKKEHYKKYEEELASSKCHDEMFATGSNAKMWTHLNNEGVSAGGQVEKLDVAPKRSTGLHLKAGIYKGKFANVQHSQFILRARRQRGSKSGEDRQVDTRPRFDNRLKDDMTRRNDDTDHANAAGALDMFCASHTRSCPQMGAEWVHR